MKLDQNGSPVEAQAPEAEPQAAQEVQEVPAESGDEFDFGAIFDRADAADVEDQEDPEAAPAQEQPEQQAQPDQTAQPAASHPTYKVVVAGQERELTQEQLARLVEQGDDYDNRAQQLDNERLRFASMQPLANAWMHDPAFRQHVMQYQQAQQPQYPGQMPQGQPLPDDPVEAIKEEAVREAVRRMQGQQQEQSRFQQEQTYIHKVQNAQRMVAGDELRADVMAAMDKIAPKGSALREAFNSNPNLFFPTYAQTRAQIVAARAQNSSGQPPQGPTVPQPTRVTPVAPLLEGGGGETPAVQPSQKERAKALRGRVAGGDLKAAGELFALAGQ